MMISNVARALSLAFVLAAVSPPGARAVAPAIDALLAEAHAAESIRATAICDDATFFRRLSLDLIGRVPSSSELEQFLARPDRAAAIDQFLSSDQHPRFWSHLWTSMLIGRGQQDRVEREVLRRWIEEQLSNDVPISQIAFQLITAQGVTSLSGPVNFVVASRQDPVMRVSRTFLSVQLDCAQCHDHPHDRWTNDDYLAMERFFRPTEFREVSGGVSVADRGPGPNAERPVFLTGRRPHTSAWRRELGLIVVQSKPFSRAMVNRVWHWLMGRGIIDPVDGLSRENPAIVPELLEELAAEFRTGGFQLRSLVRRICRSDAYQRQTPSGDAVECAEQLRFFGARTVRPQLPEQWIASVCILLDRPMPEPNELAERSRRLLGLARQATPASDPFEWTATTQTLIRQLSGELVVPLRDLDSMFLTAVAHRPTSEQRNLLKNHSSQDVIFALVHSSEFMMND